jgi:hypothetical protein
MAVEKSPPSPCRLRRLWASLKPGAGTVVFIAVVAAAAANAALYQCYISKAIIT